MKLIVGLGNPGNEYEYTRHNVGFLILDKAASFLNIRVDKKKFNALYGETIVDGEKIIFIKPQSYINLSGEVLIQYINYYKIKIEDILIISDDLNLPAGHIRLREKGSSGGHNGLKNIELHLKSNEYKRLRVGIGKSTEATTKDFVLGKLNQKEYEEVFNTCSQIIKEFLKVDFKNLMSKYN